MSKNVNEFHEARNELHSILMQMEDLADAFARTGNKSVSNELSQLSITGKAELTKMDAAFSKEISGRFKDAWVNSSTMIRTMLEAKKF